MRFLTPIALVMLLTACGGPQGNSPDAVCARESYQDPEFIRLMEIASTSTSMGFQNIDERNAALAAAKRRCLRRLGDMPDGGGVEAPKRPSSMFNGVF